MERPFERTPIEGTAMKIYRNPANRQWQLVSGQHVLYSGRRSPWQSPELLREAARQERRLGRAPRGDESPAH